LASSVPTEPQEHAVSHTDHLALPAGGTAKVDGLDTVKDFKEIRKRVGYMPGKFSLYQDLSVRKT
jgi:ABC-type multidrug transport system ATPase subunit